MTNRYFDDSDLVKGMELRRVFPTDPLRKAKETKPPMSDTDLSYAEKKPFPEKEPVGYQHPTKNITQVHTGPLAGQTLESKYGRNKYSYTTTEEKEDEPGIAEKKVVSIHRGGKAAQGKQTTTTPAYSSEVDVKTGKITQTTNPVLKKKSVSLNDKIDALLEKGQFADPKTGEPLKGIALHSKEYGEEGAKKRFPRHVLNAPPSKNDKYNVQEIDKYQPNKVKDIHSASRALKQDQYRTKKKGGVYSTSESDPNVFRYKTPAEVHSEDISRDVADNKAIARHSRKIKGNKSMDLYDACDEIMSKAKGKTTPTEMETQIPKLEHKYEQSQKRKAARGDVPKPKQKEDVDKPRIPKHIAQGKDEYLKRLQAENKDLGLSYSSDDVTVARLLKSYTPEQAEEILKSTGLFKEVEINTPIAPTAIRPEYAASGALSSKVNYPEAAKKKNPSINRDITSTSARAAQALLQSRPLTKKSIYDMCDDILNKGRISAHSVVEKRAKPSDEEAEGEPASPGSLDTYTPSRIEAIREAGARRSKERYEAAKGKPEPADED